jgi:hypothetical protein
MFQSVCGVVYESPKMYPARTQPRRAVEQRAIEGTNYVVFLTLDEGSIIKHWEGTDHFVTVSSKCEYFFEAKHMFQLPSLNAQCFRRLLFLRWEMGMYLYWYIIRETNLADCGLSESSGQLKGPTKPCKKYLLGSCCFYGCGVHKGSAKQRQSGKCEARRRKRRIVAL